jgi:predicted nucleic acid-binding protein
MPSGISQLSRHRFSANKRYFLDANVWLLNLKEPFDLKPWEKVYIDFFQTLLSTEASIYTHSLVTSEIFNAYMRSSFDKYKKDLKSDPHNTRTSSQINELDFKKFYRETDNYSFYFNLFRDDFLSYAEQLHYLDNEADINGKYLIQNLSPNTDFNDFFYSELALDHELTIVTNDSDFIFPGIEVLTEQRKLLTL